MYIFLFISQLFGQDIKCEKSSQCPEEAPCCSEYGHCGTGYDYCGIGCNKEGSYDVNSCLKGAPCDTKAIGHCVFERFIWSR